MGAVILAGVWAGAINTLVGSGTLVTFPVLLALGTPAVTANVSNSIGLVAGGVSGTICYLPELKGMGRRVGRCRRGGQVVAGCLVADPAELEEQVLLAREVDVDAGWRQPRAGGDVARGGGVESLVGEGIRCGLEEPHDGGVVMRRERRGRRRHVDSMPPGDETKQALSAMSHTTSQER